MAQYRDRRYAGVVVSIGDRAAEDRRHTERAVVISRNSLTTHDLGLAAGVQVEFHRREGKDVGHDCLFLTQSMQRLKRERGADSHAARAILRAAAVEAAWSKLLAVPARLE